MLAALGRPALPKTVSAGRRCRARPIKGQQELALALRVDSVDAEHAVREHPESSLSGAERWSAGSAPVSRRKRTCLLASAASFRTVPAHEGAAALVGECPDRQLREVNLPIDARAARVVPAADADGILGAVGQRAHLQ